MFQLYVHGHAQPEADLTELDIKNLEDLIVIAVELLNDMKLFDASVLNPINYLMVVILEYAL